ncbi:MAG: hypothetical protein PHZ07_00035 [Patescibacteria group bacterium]|nr:hypothetical protein [Patescibacteria group bacterium]MDD4304125.1 hypothetical protein [Patescibacteria group bacterium]MDD4695156.1 hypothetical protein [Patescibacteria group bacterium]
MLYKKGIVQIPENTPANEVFQIELPIGSIVQSAEHNGEVLYDCPAESVGTEKISFILQTPIEDGTMFDVPDGYKPKKIGKIKRGDGKLTLSMLKKKHTCSCQ